MRYLGIDYGIKKIGFAVSEGMLASALTVADISSLKDGVFKVSKVIDREKIERVVVGMPEGKAGRDVKRFLSELEKLYGNSQVEVIEADETLSSKDAKKLMIDLNLTKRARSREDAYAAVLILQNFLDSLE